MYSKLAGRFSDSPQRPPPRVSLASPEPKAKYPRELEWMEGIESGFIELRLADQIWKKFPRCFLWNLNDFHAKTTAAFIARTNWA